MTEPAKKRPGRPKKTAAPPGGDSQSGTPISEQIPPPITADNFAEKLEQSIMACAKDPLRFVLLVFPWGKGSLERFQGPDKWQIEHLGLVRDGLMTPEEAIRIAVTSGHGVGKSALVAWLILWAISTKVDTKGVVTANTEVQLKTKTWAELSKWYHIMLHKHWFNFSATSIYSADPDHERTWRIDQIPWSVGNPEAFAGMHNQGRRILWVFDEASAIDDVIWEVSEGALTDSNTEILWFVFGNPTKNSGRFRECFGKSAHRWKTLRVDSRDSMLSKKEQIAEWEEDYGSDSDFFRVRVRGEFPRMGSEQFISHDDVAICRKYRAPDQSKFPKILGVDVARFGDDSSVIFLRQGRKCTLVARLSSMDGDEVGFRVCEAAEEHDVDAIVVDADGVGVAVVDSIRRVNGHIRHGVNVLHQFHSGVKLGQSSPYYNRRAEVWGLMRVALKEGLEIPDRAELEEDLCGPHYGPHRITQQILLEAKVDMKSRGLRSPDLGDALAYTFAVKLQAKRAVVKTPGLRVRPNVGWMC